MNLFEQLNNINDEDSLQELEEASQRDAKADALEKLRDRGITNVVDRGDCLHVYQDDGEYDLSFNRVGEPTARKTTKPRRFKGTGTIIDGIIYDEQGNKQGSAYVGKSTTENRYDYELTSSNQVLKGIKTIDDFINMLKEKEA